MTSTSRSARLAKWLSLPVGLVISALLIWQASYAAFSDKATVTGTLGTATLDVSLDDEAKASFEVPDLLPGDTVTHEVTARYTGPDGVDVKFYAEPLSEGEELAQQLDLQVFATTPAGSFGVPATTRHRLFDDTLAGFVDVHGPTGTEYTATAQNGDSVTLEFVITLDKSAKNDLMGKSLDVTFVGEATSRGRG